MMELGKLYIKEATLNKAWVLFDTIEKAIAWEKILDDLHVSNVKLVYHKENKLYFGFKMFRCRYQMPKLILQLNKVETTPKLKEVYEPKLKAGVTFFDEFAFDTGGE